jgi:hypothetical protein
VRACALTQALEFLARVPLGASRVRTATTCPPGKTPQPVKRRLPMQRWQPGARALLDPHLADAAERRAGKRSPRGCRWAACRCRTRSRSATCWSTPRTRASRRFSSRSRSSAATSGCTRRSTRRGALGRQRCGVAPRGPEAGAGRALRGRHGFVRASQGPLQGRVQCSSYLMPLSLSKQPGCTNSLVLGWCQSGARWRQPAPATGRAGREAWDYSG